MTEAGGSEGADRERFSEERLSDLLQAVKLESDRLLASGQSPSAEPWIERYPEAASEIEALVELRIIAHEVQMEEKTGGDSREVALATIGAKLQDAVNRNEQPDLETLVDRQPGLEQEIRALAEDLDRLQETLDGEEIVGSAQRRTSRETTLGAYQLASRIDTHPLGPIYLAKNKDESGSFEVLVIRPFRRVENTSALLDRVAGTCALKGDGLLPLHEVGRSDGVHFLAYQHAEGTSLGHALETVLISKGTVSLSDILYSKTDHRDESRTVREDIWSAGDHLGVARDLCKNQDYLSAVVWIVTRVAAMLTNAHEQGIVHSGLAPRAVVIGRRGKISLRWFQISEDLGERLFEGNALLWYLAPELVLRETARSSWRVDVYGLGALLYTALRLEPPHLGFTDIEQWQARIAEAPPRLSLDLPDLPKSLCALVERCLSRDPLARPPSCQAVKEMLDRILKEHLGGERPRRFGFLRSLIKRYRTSR